MATARRRTPWSMLAAFAGTLFSAPLLAQYLVIHSFEIDEGNSPRSTLVQDSSGNLYGTAVFGGENGNGSVFKLEPDGDNFATASRWQDSSDRRGKR